ncbi:hypothetical protein GA0070624_5267 [Micromonospora rhizosphaerae]|uniref:Uncharacterized protein n=1 Tax=Micromonospora rhizosphaerae TaxID=568872 RepID=A0A1C6T271_9ACTN|nr:hypothetical protein GA0070624_5267 [Micromonospora rhizosphaerae]
MAAADGTAETLKLLLEVCTVRSPDDPRALHITTNLARASDQLTVAADRIGTVFAVGRDVAAAIVEQHE